MTKASDDHQIRCYLLGDLPATEEAVLERAYFGDPTLLERIELARDDLADDYASGRLSAHDREKFERLILATNEGREQAAIARALRAAAGTREMSQKAVWFHRRWVGLAAAVLLAISVFAVWRLSSGPEHARDRVDVNARQTIQPSAPPPPSPAPDDRTPPPNQPQPNRSPLAPAQLIVTLLLTTDLERGGGQPPTLTASTGATHVDLIAPRDSLPAGTARARVESAEGASVWSGSITIPAAAAIDPRPRARVPVSALPPGDYLFSIEPAASPDRTGGPRYYFRVRAR